MGRIVEGRWNCQYCQTKEILGRHQSCPNCGRPRDKDFKPYLPKNIEDNYVPVDEAKKINKNPDWMCSYCQSYNSDSYNTCSFCGASRQESQGTYFDIQKQKTDSEPKHTSTESVKKTSLNSNHDDCSKNAKFNIKGILMFLIASFLVVLLFILIIALLKPKEINMNVNEMSWSRTIEIEKYQTVLEDDWFLPQNARLLYTTEEFHHFETVIDHYETKSREIPKQRIVGYDTYTTYKDLGNGYFEEEEHSEPIYETYYETEYYEEPVYEDIEIYQTKYYYEIDKWLYERSIKTSGKDKSPFWGEFTLANDEREGSKKELYQVTGLVKDTTKTVSVSFDDWEKIDVDQNIKLKVFLGSGKLIE